MGMKKYDSLEEYLDDLPEATKNTILNLREILFETVPDVEEIFKSNYIRYSLVSGCKFNQQIMITGYANHVGFYPHSTVIKLFENGLADYKTGKGTIQFQNNAQLPKDLIIQIVLKMKQMIVENQL